MSETVLKGGIEKTANIKYIWVSNGGCGACEDLDGEEFDSADDIPDKPHPNCQCYVDVVEIVDDEDDEECDVADQVDAMFDEVDEMAGDVDSTKEEGESVCSFIENAIGYPICQFIVSLGESILNAFEEAMAAYDIFVSNKAEMEEFRGYDKYYHAKANCEATQLGEIGELSAHILSIGKEVKDLLYKVIVKKKDFEETWNDCMEDLKADEYGIRKGHEEGQCGESVKDVGTIFGRVEKTERL